MLCYIRASSSAMMPAMMAIFLFVNANVVFATSSSVHTIYVADCNTYTSIMSTFDYARHQQGPITPLLTCASNSLPDYHALPYSIPKHLTEPECIVPDSISYWFEHEDIEEEWVLIVDPQFVLADNGRYYQSIEVDPEAYPDLVRLPKMAASTHLGLTTAPLHFGARRLHMRPSALPTTLLDLDNIRSIASESYADADYDQEDDLYYDLVASSSEDALYDDYYYSPSTRAPLGMILMRQQDLRVLAPMWSVYCRQMESAPDAYEQAVSVLDISHIPLQQQQYSPDVPAVWPTASPFVSSFNGEYEDVYITTRYELLYSGDYDEPSRATTTTMEMEQVDDAITLGNPSILGFTAGVGTRRTTICDSGECQSKDQTQIYINVSGATLLVICILVVLTLVLLEAVFNNNNRYYE